MLQRIFALFVKELIAVWKDKKSRAVLIFPPLIQLCVFTWAATLDVKNVSIGILNLDYGKPAYELVQRFHTSSTFHKITYLHSFDEIEKFIQRGNGLMVLSIDEQFSKNLEKKSPSSVQLILDGRKSNATQILAGYATQIIEHFYSNFALDNEIATQPTYLVTRNWFNPNLFFYWYNVPCLFGVLTMVVGLLVTALSIARERELGTFNQLLVSPCTPLEMLIGKALPAIIIGILEGSLILIVGVLLFQVPFEGNLLFLYFAMLCFICAIVGIGLFISSLCFTQQQAILGGFMFMVPAIILSGFATPIENMPKWLQYFTLANPLRYFLVITKGIFLKNMNFSIVLSNIWPMILIAIFTNGLASWYFRKRLE